MNERWTDIGRIGAVKREGTEWSELRRTFTLDEAPEYAELRLQADGTCGIFLNGEFVRTNAARHPGRVFLQEVTSRLRTGENEIALRLGSGYYQDAARDIRKRRGAWVSWAAAELTVQAGGDTRRIVTDGSWTWESDEGAGPARVFSNVARGEYDRIWRHAALWKEGAPDAPPPAVVEVAGQAYADFCAKGEPETVVGRVIDGSMHLLDSGAVCSRTSDMSSLYRYDKSMQPWVVFDLGRINVGCVEMEYESDREGEAVFRFDCSSSTEDFDPSSYRRGRVETLSLRVMLHEGKHTLRLLRRRAFRYVKITFEEHWRTIRVDRLALLCQSMPPRALGWFHSGDEVLDRAWEAGRWTLQVNKQAEYESCPRSETKFFTGDGIIDELVDFTTFGDGCLTDASLSLAEFESADGLRPNRWRRDVGLWDYPAWRILMAWEHYRHFGDRTIVETYFDDLADAAEWTADQIGPDGLIWQYPVTGDPFGRASGSVEYSCSFDRLGAKPYLNALAYRALDCMAGMADLVGDGRGPEWRRIAARMKDAVNECLWSEEKGAYLDEFDPDYIPQDGNALAVLFGVAEGARARRALETLRRENWSPYGSAILSRERNHTRGGSRTVSPAMNTWEAEARFLQGDASGALDLIRNCWGTMLDKGAQTFWEFAPNHPTDIWPFTCHAWSAGCTWLLNAYVLGVRPETPGYGTMRFTPCGLLEDFSGVVTTARGLVAVRCRAEGGRRHYTLAVPAGTKLITDLPEGAELTVREY